MSPINTSPLSYKGRAQNSVSKFRYFYRTSPLFHSNPPPPPAPTPRGGVARRRKTLTLTFGFKSQRRSFTVPHNRNIPDCNEATFAVPPRPVSGHLSKGIGLIKWGNLSTARMRTKIFLELVGWWVVFVGRKEGPPPLTQPRAALGYSLAVGF